MITKALLYCTKNYPMLYRHFDNKFMILKETREECLYNGKVVAVCDIEVEEIEWLDSNYCDSDIGYCTDNLSPLDLEHRSWLTSEQIKKYLWKNGKGYAIHIKNLKVFDEPKELYEFRGKRPNGLTFVLEKAPQNMCYCWYKGEKFALISIQPQWLVKILNGEKKIEVRKKVLKEMLCQD